MLIRLDATPAHHPTAARAGRTPPERCAGLVARGSLGIVSLAFISGCFAVTDFNRRPREVRDSGALGDAGDAFIDAAHTDAWGDPHDAGTRADAGVDAALDADRPDGGPDDDAGPLDTGPDAGPPDSGPDASVSDDAGPIIDAGPDDAVIDAGADDAGSIIDAGPIDAGPDASGPVDAGPVDAGPIDASSGDIGPASDAHVSLDAGGCPTNNDLSCGACGLACTPLSACVPGGALGHRCVPRDCEGVRARRQASGAPLVDGVYEIDADGAGPMPVIDVYCADLASSSPLEYLDVDPATNFSSAKDHDQCAECNFRRRTWTRVRLVILRASGVAFLVDARDRRWTTVTGYRNDGTENPACAGNQPSPCINTWDPTAHPIPNSWGAVFSCGYRAPAAETQLDLGGTGFRFPAGTDTSARVLGPAFQPSFTASLDSTRERLTLRGTAACGNFGIPALASDPSLTPIELAP